MKNYAVLIPAYNPMAELPEYINKLISLGAYMVVVVNDGSQSKYAPIFEAAAKIPDCQVIGYTDNRGKGAALKFGFSYLYKNYPGLAGVVTADADGQHRASDVAEIGRHVTDYDASYIIGMRDFTQDHVPFRSWLGNRFTTLMFYLFYGTLIKDTQTGLRGIKMRELPELIQIPGERFEYEINMLIWMAKCHKSYQMVHIQTVYADDHTSNYDTWKDSVRIGRQMIKGIHLETDRKE